MIPPPPRSTLFPYPTLFRSIFVGFLCWLMLLAGPGASLAFPAPQRQTTRSPHGPLAIPCENCHTAAGGRPIKIDRKSKRLNSSHLLISYAAFCFNKKCPSVH